MYFNKKVARATARGSAGSSIPHVARRRDVGFYKNALEQVVIKKYHPTNENVPKVAFTLNNDTSPTHISEEKNYGMYVTTQIVNSWVGSDIPQVRQLGEKFIEMYQEGACTKDPASLAVILNTNMRDMIEDHRVKRIDPYEKIQNRSFSAGGGLSFLANNTTTASTEVFTPALWQQVAMYNFAQSVAGDIFPAVAMPYSKALIVRMFGEASKTLGDATAGSRLAENSFTGYGTGLNTTTLTGTGVGPYTGTINVTPLTTRSTLIYVNGKIVGMDNDNDNGAIRGDGLDSATVNIATGDISVTFDADPGTTNIMASAIYDSENAPNDTNFATLEINPETVYLDAKQRVLKAQFSQFAEFQYSEILGGATLASTLDMIAQQELLRGVDNDILIRGYEKGLNAQGQPYRTIPIGSGVDKLGDIRLAVAQIKGLADDIRNEYNRGTIDTIITSSKVAELLYNSGNSYEQKNDTYPKNSTAGVYKDRTYNGIDVYIANSDIVPNNRALALYAKSPIKGDNAMVYGLYKLMYKSPNIQIDLNNQVTFANYSHIVDGRRNYARVVEFTGDFFN